MTRREAPSPALSIVGFCAISGTGKTTLLKKLLPLLCAKKLRVGVIKHAHHGFDTDLPGKDSYELRHAGAEQMLISSGRRHALVTELPENTREPTLQELLPKLDLKSLDLVLVEGFKKEFFPKIELHRTVLARAPLYPHDPNIIAFASDGHAPENIRIPVLPINDSTAIADFIVRECGGLLRSPW